MYTLVHWKVIKQSSKRIIQNIKQRAEDKIRTAHVKNGQQRCQVHWTGPRSDLMLGF
jgi:hypothetical protein